MGSLADAFDQALGEGDNSSPPPGGGLVVPINPERDYPGATHAHEASSPVPPTPEGRGGVLSKAFDAAAETTGKPSPVPKSEDQGPTLGSMGANFASGVNRGGVAGFFGMPADLSAGVARAIYQGVTGEDRPALAHPFLGSEWIAEHMGMFSPNKVQPQNEAERHAQSFGEGVGGVLTAMPAIEAVRLGTAGVRAAIRPFVAPAPGANLLEKGVNQVFNATGTPLVPRATDLLAGGTQSVVGNVAANQDLIPVPEKAKPLVATVAGAAAGAPFAAATAGRAVAAKAVSKITPGLSRSAAENRVGQELVANASDPEAALNRLQTDPDEIAGGKLTLGQKAQDQGLTGWESDVRQRNKTEFSEREQQQNTAAANTLRNIQPEGDVEALPGMLAERKEGVEAANAARQESAQQTVNSSVAAAEAAHAQALDNLRGASTANAPADVAARVTAFQRSLDVMEMTQEERGAGAREPAAAQLEAAKKVVKQAYDEVGNVPVNTAPILRAAKNIASDMVEENSPITGAEARIHGIITRTIEDEEGNQVTPYAGQRPLKNVQALRSSVLSEMANTRRTDPQAYRRLNILLDSIDKAIEVPLEQRLASDKIAVERGAMDPKDSLAAQLGEDAEQVSQRGGDAGRAEARAGSRPGPGPEAAPGANGAAGEAALGPRAAAVNSGVSEGPGAQAPSPAGPRDLADRTATGNPAPPEQEAVARSPQAEAAVGAVKRVSFEPNPYASGISEGGRTLYVDPSLKGVTVNNRDGQPVSVVPFLLRHEAVEKHAMELGNPYQTAHEIASISERDAVENAGIDWNDYSKAVRPGIEAAKKATSAPKDMFAVDEHEAELQGAQSSDALAKQAEANRLYREMKETSGRGVVGKILEKQPRGTDYRVSDANVPGKIWKKGADGGETVNAYLKGAAGPEGAQALHDVIVGDFKDAAVGADGSINPAKANKWLDDHGPALREAEKAIPGLRSNLQRVTIDGAFKKLIPEEGAPQVSKLQKYVDDNSKTMAEVYGPEEVGAIRSGIAKTEATGQAIEDTKAQGERVMKMVNEVGKQNLSKYEKGILSDLIKADGEDAIIKKLGSLDSTKAGALMDEAAQIPGGTDAVRKAYSKMLAKRFSNSLAVGLSEDAEISASKISTYIRDNMDTLKRVLTPEQIGAIKGVGELERRMVQTRTATQLKGGSSTYSSKVGSEKQTGDHGGLSTLWAIIGEHLGGHLTGDSMIGNVAGLGIPLVVKAIRQAGFRNMEQLRLEIAMNPEKGRQVLELALRRNPPPNYGELMAARIRALGVAAAQSGMRQTPENSERSTKALP